MFLLHHRADQLTNYAIMPNPKGYVLWRFRPWNRRNRGWRIISTHTTRDQAEQELLERLDLEPATPKPKLIMASVQYVDEDYGFGGWT